MIKKSGLLELLIARARLSSIKLEVQRIPSYLIIQHNVRSLTITVPNSIKVWLDRYARTKRIATKDISQRVD